MSKDYVALHDNVFVKEKKQQRKVGAMIVPDSLDVDFTFGTVVSVGPGQFIEGHFVPMSVTVGDEICFPRTMGQKINFVNADDDLIMVKESAITAKIAEIETIIEDSEN